MLNNITNVQMYLNPQSTHLEVSVKTSLLTVPGERERQRERERECVCVCVCVCVLPSANNTGLIRIAVMSQHCLQPFILSTARRPVWFQDPEEPHEVRKTN